MSILFSCVGTTDPIRGLRDGSMLHIVRHYRPGSVILFLSEEMDRLNQRDGRFQKCFQYISEQWEGYSPQVHYRKAETEDPTDFDAVGAELLRCIEDCANRFPGEEILLNLSSGTPQMKMILAQAAVDTRYRTRGIQVKNPELKAGTTSRTNDDKYDVDVALELNDDEAPGSENRCLEPKLLVVQRDQQRERIHTMLELRDYTALRGIRKVLPSELQSLVIHLDERNHLNKRRAIEYGKKARQECPELFPLYPSVPKDARPHDLIDMTEMTDYFLMLRNLQRTKSYTSLVLRLNPFIITLQECLIDQLLPDVSFRDTLVNRSISKNKLDPAAFQKLLPDVYARVNTELARRRNTGLEERYMSMMVCNVMLQALSADKEMLSFFRQMESLNQEVRNDSAHKLLEVSESDIIQYSNMTSAQIINSLSALLQTVYPVWNSDWSKLYDRCNQFIMAHL